MERLPCGPRKDWNSLGASGHHRGQDDRLFALATWSHTASALLHGQSLPGHPAGTSESDLGQTTHNGPEGPMKEKTSPHLLIRAHRGQLPSYPPPPAPSATWGLEFGQMSTSSSRLLIRTQQLFYLLPPTGALLFVPAPGRSWKHLCLVPQSTAFENVSPPFATRRGHCRHTHYTTQPCSAQEACRRPHFPLLPAVRFA